MGDSEKNQKLHRPDFLSLEGWGLRRMLSGAVRTVKRGETKEMHSRAPSFSGSLSMKPEHLCKTEVILRKQVQRH